MNIIIDTPQLRYSEWPACSGADTKSIIDNQISAIDEESDRVTLTVRGNDVGFGDCANVCISKVNRIPDCSETLDNTGNLIANDLLVKLDWCSFGNPDPGHQTRLQALLYGLSSFLERGHDAMQRRRLLLLGGYDPNKLTQELRTQMNGLTQALNLQIDAAIGHANSRDKRQPVIRLRRRLSRFQTATDTVTSGPPSRTQTNPISRFQEKWLFINTLDFSGDSDAIKWQIWAQQ
ncbi:hypothetical protein ABVK25_003631 [Lepraria finkii]|uniref:Uncharacterized protein n=1 Tax=Lepraria finkii TaxID=1340010 RepID=A0ABR4BDS4_9LECA